MKKSLYFTTKLRVIGETDLGTQQNLKWSSLWHYLTALN